MITRTEAIKRFLIQSTHLDLAELYNKGMEVQINVAQDNGQRIDRDFKGRIWQSYTDNIENWYPIRIPRNAKQDDFIFEDKPMDYNLEAHVEAIGMTGWDFQNKISRWVAFDFDFISGHSNRHTKKLTEIELQEIVNLTTNIPWVTLRKSTGGRGLHIYVFINPNYNNNLVIKNHNEHSALARAILGKMSALVGYDFQSKVDVNGGNMWVWHRKIKSTNGEGLKLIKQGILLSEIPINWRDHINVISGSHKRSILNALESTKDNVDLFEEITTQKNFIKLDDNHKQLIQWLEENNARWWWDQDRHILITHTVHLKEAHEALGLKGIFDTFSKGSEIGNDHNCFLSNLRGGGWIVRRYTPGVAESPLWFQDGHGYTSIYYNREPDLPTLSRAFGGIETTHTKGGFVFREAEVAEKVASLLGTTLDLPVSLNSRETKLRIHKDGRLIVEIERKETDTDNKLSTWLPDKKLWKKIFIIKTPPIDSSTDTGISNHDNLVRHVITETGEDYGWLIKNDSTGKWIDEPLVHIKAALKSTGLIPKQIDNVIGQCITKCWILVNQPFQPEYPGDRLWNRNAAQLRFSSNKEKENLNYPNWSLILNHLGKNLTPAIVDNEWCKINGILTGADYLKLWIASLFQEPNQPLPYLFFYGDSNTGKSIFHESLALLVTHGVCRADQALVSNFNGELANSILAIVEETDLNKNKSAYNKIKDYVTSRMLPIHEKNRTPYLIPNTLHLCQCANEMSACPVFPGDKRIIIIPVDIIPNDRIIPKKQFIQDLEKEAPDFLTEIMKLEIPQSQDRLNLPIITTNEKIQIEQSNKNPLELFLEQFCFYRPGKMIKFADFYDRFIETLDPNYIHLWPRHRIGKELPNKYPKGRLYIGDPSHYIGNMSFDPPENWDSSKLNPNEYVPTEYEMKGKIICVNERLKFEQSGEHVPSPTPNGRS